LSQKCERTWNEEREIKGRFWKADSIRRSVRQPAAPHSWMYLTLPVHWRKPDEDVDEGWGALVEPKEEARPVDRRIELSDREPVGVLAGRLRRCTSLQATYSASRPNRKEMLPYCQQQRDRDTIAYFAHEVAGC